ncbi:MAG: amidohydrolase family protein [Clostridia bacterium]|nr:amidohydrolase family protein [Clostridia bacterium]
MNNHPNHPVMTRRTFLKTMAAGAAAASASLTLPGLGAGEAIDTVSSATPASIAFATSKEIEIQPPEEAVRYDLIDSHLHFTDFLEDTDGFPALCQAMDMAGVSQAVIFGMPIAKQWDATMEMAPSYYLSNDSRCYYYSATDFILAEELLAQPPEIRKRFFPFCCGINGNDRFAADHIRQLLRLYPDFWCGIGEIMSRHDDLTALTYGEAPHVNSQAFLDVFDLAAEENLPVLVHHNITAQSEERVLYRRELEEALAHNRDCKIIWAHIGISRRVEVQDLIPIAAELLDAHPNLYVDISWLVYDYYFLDRFPDNYMDGNTLEDWVAFIEKYQDRVLVGTDKVGHWATYPAEVVKYYSLLDRLSPEAVRKICRDNVLKLIHPRQIG